MEYKTINNIDCYGKLAIGHAVEVNTEYDSYIIDNSDFTKWSEFITWAKEYFVNETVVECLSDYNATVI